MMHRRTTLKLAAFAIAALLAGTAAANAESVLRRGNGAEPETIDPHKSTGVPENAIENDLFEGLVAWGPDGKEVPGVAKSWDISDDGTVYTFHLRDDAKWSNGDAVTAADFVYSFQRAVDPKTASDYAPILSPIKNADAIIAGKITDLSQLGVTAPDAHTVVISLNASTPYLLGLLTHNIAMPVHKATVEKFGDQWTRPGNMVSNGPFMLADWVPQSQLTIVKNPNFHDAASVKLDKIIYYPTEDIAEELKRYRAGELDITYDVPSDQVKWVEANMKDEFHNTPYFGTYYYVINLTRDTLGKAQQIRKALALGIDREILVDKITQAGELPAYSWVPPDVPGYQQQFLDFKNESKAQRLEEAKKLLADAGYGPDKPLKIQLLYNTSENHKKIAVAIAAMWKPLGVQLELVNQEWKVYLETRDKKDFDIARAAWIGDYPDPINFLDMFKSDAGARNDAGYNNPKFDELLTTAGATVDPKKRLAILAQAEKVFLDDYAMIPIYHYTTKHMLKPNLVGWEANVLDIHPGRYLSLKS
ncbi:peptide ABC transporter substrate-binding protein [Hypericibacter adhaerens]|jgi:oligopeptide transport system substrate-binding protein|uniref:Peptide ABC transporter substrate-binding protein n=1 Tax=Hypericibacter adhaerens TaxID=2602016 RepID=A0A5J6N638_9PROT|nr:peptide ABC transporter substrate-binding protein [Hypericibacter adhaerens]QEX24070.1 peptide ABC transporter substrate-binding protein [Hypericibacter adhaerens]